MGREGEGRSEEGGKGKEGWEERGGKGEEGPAYLWFKRWSHFFHFGRRFLMGQVCSVVCVTAYKKKIAVCTFANLQKQQSSLISVHYTSWNGLLGGSPACVIWSLSLMPPLTPLMPPLTPLMPPLTH